MREFSKYILTKYTVSLYLLSILFLLLAALLSETYFTKSMSNILTIFGTGILMTTFVSSILNYYFQMNINLYFSIISGAEKSGIRRIYANREDAISEINSEFERARGNIELLSIAGTDFFHTSRKILNELDEMCEKNSNNKVRILLLDPRSKHAIDRALIEEGFDISETPIEEFRYPNKTLCKNIFSSLDMLERILEDKQKENKDNFKLEIRTYDTAPILLFVQVNGRTFVEQYHYGIAEEERQTNLTKCIGKKVPIVEFRPNSLSAQLLLSHFDYIWKTSSTQKVYPGFSQWLFKVILEKKVWYIVYNETKKITEKYLRTERTETSDNSG